MTKWSLAGLLILLLLLAPVAAHAFKRRGAAPTDSTPGSGVPLSLVAAQVVKTLDTFNAEAGSRALPKLSKVVFDFNTERTLGGGFGFNVLFFRFGANRDSSATNEVSFTYTVPAAPAPSGAFSPRTQPATHDFSHSLLSTLQAAAAQVKETQHIGAANFTNLTVVLSYGVVWDTSAGGAGTIGLVTLDGSVDRKRSDVQTLTLIFGQ